MDAPLTFGTVLKKIRLEEANIGLRDFAELIDTAPSNLSAWERDRKAPPASVEKIKQICDALGLIESDPRREMLYDLAAKAKDRIAADVKNACKDCPGVPVLVRTIAKKQLSEEKLKELAEYIQKNY